MAVVKTLIGNVKGPKGDTGAKGDTGTKGDIGATGQRGSRWTQGTAITGTSTTATIFSNSGISDALVNDNYLNTSTGNTYRCTADGDASTAKWVYLGNIKGVKGDTGPKGDKGDTGATGPQGPQGVQGESSFKDHDTATSGTSFTDAEDGNMIVTDWTKNLLNPTLETTTQNGVTCTNNGDGTYTLNGTSTGQPIFFLNENVNVTGSNLKLVCCPPGRMYDDKVYSQIMYDDYKWGESDLGDGVVINSGKNILKVIFTLYPGYTVNNLVIKPMLTTDLSATYDDFVPYGGYEIQSCGKNLVESYYVTKTELQYEATLFIKADLQPDTDYVISLVGANGNYCYLNEYLFEQNGSIAFDGTRQYVIAHTKAVFQSDQYIDGYGWIIFKNSTGNTVVPNFKDIQLEKASKPTPFEPYQGETIKVTNETESPAFGLKSHKGITNIISPGNVKCVYPTNESGKGVLDAMYNNSQLSNELSKLKNAIIAMGGTV